MRYLKNILLTLVLLKFSFSFSMDHIAIYFCPRYEFWFEDIIKSKKIKDADLQLIRAIDNYSLWPNIFSKNDARNKIIDSVKKGANINIKNKFDESLIYLACEYGDIKIIKLLIYLKIDPKNQNLCAALWNYIIQNKYNGNNIIDIVKNLITAGGDFLNYNKKDWDNHSFLDKLNDNINKNNCNKSREIKNIIEKKEAIIKEIYDIIDNNDIIQVKNLLLKGYKYFYDPDQNNMLHIAALKHKPEIFMFIFKKLPELIYEKNKHGKTPIDLNQNMLVHLINFKRSKKQGSPKVEENTNEQSSCNLM